MRIAIGNDHAGTDFKKAVVSHLEKSGYKHIENFGTDTLESTDYADYIHPMCDSIEEGNNDIGIAICGSGNGVNMTANKHLKIRSALCWNNEIAMLARSHNNANVIAIPARFISIETAIQMIDTFIDTKFEGGRHERRINKIPIC